ncbi:hypothetical protein WN55_05072 [Dufourea novaeangliae]|uniref:C2H2-type domain-containing protein n=1 Tax=Dufourea novaeangliae TaxID=178035 RepID=A0A154PQW5_DUFNO|nr:hypothetical protein WN55_05072 [Dufourea novaeangliae]
MNYGGNMPDWHQFNASQTNEVTPATQNVNSGHLAFIPGVSPPTLNAHSFSSEGLNKHQHDSNFNPRNFQSFNNVSNGTNISNNSPLASMVQMQNCIGHYSSPNTRNPMLDNLNPTVDPRNNTIGNINNELGYRSNQVSFNGPISHLNGPTCNLSTSSGPVSGLGSRTNSGPGPGTSPGNGSGPGTGPIFGPGPRHGPVSGTASGSGSVPTTMGPRNTNIGSVHAGKPGPPAFMPCKGMCCNSDANINYQQWEKFGPYQNNTPYRDNAHPSNYQTDNRHFGNNCNFRKENLDGKETMGSVMPSTPVVDHRRNFTDYKYHKDHLLHRNYSTSTGLFPNYPTQNYNYSTEQQTYPYPVKEHSKTSNISIPNSGMLKHPEQNFVAQQKYNNKQYQYQNRNMLPKGVPALNVSGNMVSSPQNAYFNSQFSRNIPAEMSPECQEINADNTTVSNRIAGAFVHSSPSQHQTYQHKMAMQKFSMENHLRELSRIPGYQSHPKYKEYVMRYREILKLQQSTGYQNHVQQTSRVSTPINTAVPPINLQFDQNGMLINSNYLPNGIPKLQHASPAEQSSETMEKQIKDQAIAIANEKCQQTQQQEQLMIPSQSEQVPSTCIESFQKQSFQQDFNQNQLKVQTSDSHSFDTLNTDNSKKTMIQQKPSKEFANKPELDVRQFLANWDETDEEDGATSNLPDAVLNETTPVVVVSYENVDLSSKTSLNRDLSRKNSFSSNDTTLDNGNEAEASMITQDCLTISYSSSDANDITKTTKRTIGEGVVKPGSIIHCISNGPDEIPTIHIVDNLEISNILGASSDQVIETLEKQKTVPFFKEVTNNETEEIILETAEQNDKDEPHRLPAGYDDVAKNTNIENSNVSETIQTTTVPINNQGLRVLSAAVKNNLDVTDELKKQNSFASEESHNPDDISLPDLPTSECTPISTTLNTPIHSDSEESSQNMEDLSISTNPIEVMQNSPVISFTQSPVKIEPYEQLNSEDKLKNKSLGMLELELQKQNCYTSDSSSTQEQDTSLSNFDFSTENCKPISTDLAEDKQIKCLETNLAREKVFLVEGKESNARVSDTYSVKSAIQTNNSLADADKAVHVVISTGSNANLVNSTGSDDETQSSKHEELTKKQKVNNINVSINTINPNLAKTDLNTRKRVKENIGLTDKCIDRNASGDKLMQAQKKDVDGLMLSKHSDIKRLVRVDSVSSQEEEQAVCHMTSQYKNYSIAVIKDNVILSDKKSPGTTEKTVNVCYEKPLEFRLKTNCTKELSDEVEMKKHSEGCKMSELVQKDLDTVDGDIRYVSGEVRQLSESNRKKHKLHQDKNTEEKLQKYSQIRENRSELLAVHKISLEQNVLSPDNLSSDNLDVSEEVKRLKYVKSFIMNTNSDRGVQVADLKIKDSELRKELILENQGPEYIKDTLDGIKIQINVSCTDRNFKGQDQNKQFLYEIGDTSSNLLDSQRRIHSTEHKTVEYFDKVHEMIEKSPVVRDTTINKTIKITNDAATSVANTNMSTTLRSSGKNSLEANDDALSSITSKEIAKTNSAISNTAIVDASNKMLVKAKNKFEGEEKFMNTEGDHTVRTQNESANFAECSSRTIVEACKINDDAVDRVSRILKNLKKLPDTNLVELHSKSLSSLSTLDFNLDKLEYEKCSGVKTDELDDNYMGKWKKPKTDHIFEDCDMFQSTSGYINPIFSNIDELEDLHTVPVYTTKDGKISYSPNRRFTYHELMMEARRREISSIRKSHHTESWNSYYSSMFRELCKKKRHHGLNEKKKHEYKNTKYLFERKRNYSNDFSGKNSVKCKAYMHSIKNNNAAWSNHCRTYRVYSNSDSDEEIIIRNENHVAETNNYGKNYAIENKTVTATSKTHKREVTAEDLELENINRRIGENLKSDVSEIPMPDKSCDVISKNIQPCEDKNLNKHCGWPEIKEIDDASVHNNDEKGISIKENQISCPPIFEETKDNEIHVPEGPVPLKNEKQECSVMALNNQNSLSKIEDTFKNMDRTETCKVLKINQSDKSVYKTDKSDMSQQKLKDIFEPELSKNMSSEIEDELLKNNNSATHEKKFVKSADIIVQSKTVIGQNMKTTESLRLRKNDVQKESSGKNDVTYVNQEEYESQVAQIDTTINHRSVQCSNVKEIRYNESVNINSTQANDRTIINCNGSAFTDLSKATVHIEKDNTTNNSVTSLRNKVDVILPGIKENPTEESMIPGEDSKECSSASCPDELQSEHESNLNCGSSVEVEMPVLSMHCATKKCLLDCTESESPFDKYDAKPLSDLRPKIPKMVIIKSKSRSATPTTEILEKPKSEKTQTLLPEQNDTDMDVETSDAELYMLKYKNYEGKVPKVKIKLEDISSKDLKLYLKRKATKSISKVKMKKIRTQKSKNPTKYETEDSSEIEISDSENDEKIQQESLSTESEKIPKSKLRRQDENQALSPKKSKEQDTNISKPILKKPKKIKEEDTTQLKNGEIRKKFPQCIIEKIPKVIIKRTQIGTEFKCEISKNKKTPGIDTSKWQPRVKLQRLKVLDHMAKDIKQSNLGLNDESHIKDSINKKDSARDSKVKLCRSSSASNLSPVKCKQRRLSDPNYIKMDVKSTDFINIISRDSKHKPLDTNEIPNLKVVDSENKSLKRKGKKSISSESKRINNSLNDESENEMEKTNKSKNATEKSFNNVLTNEDNDLLIEKKGYSSFGTKESESSIEDKYLLCGILHSRNLDDNDISIIKVDSSDESQTTIEFLPASPDSGEEESKNREFECTNRIDLEDAIPTQLELELDLIDNNGTQLSDVPADKYNHVSRLKKENINERLTNTFFNDFQHSSQDTFKNEMQSPKRKSNDYFSSTDLLVKEVLAAKETLKKCLTRSKDDNAEKSILRTKTVAEKKQGLCFNFKDLENYKLEDAGSTCTVEKEYQSDPQLDIEKAEGSHSKQDQHSCMGQDIKLKESQEEITYSVDYPTASTCGYTSVPESITISLKATKKYGEITINEGSLNIATNTFNPSNNLSSIEDTTKLHEEKSEKKTISSTQNPKDNDSSNETKTKEDNMPLLVPEFALHFDSSSDRDSSRSPPVITNQEESDNVTEDPKDTKDKVITSTEKIEENVKHSYKDCEMTIADIMTQLAYHEKATIKHRRYCNLCERWFPTTSRHRRHLAGYQHRYMELTQRKSIHALFILFTGRPCPRLLPANVIRNDCCIGELTPLQIAVQDVANYVEPTENLKTIE